MPTVIICVGLVTRTDHAARTEATGKYLMEYDPEAVGGRGRVRWTADAARARRYADKAAAYEEWRRVPRRKPVRADGQPNRPLTAFTIITEEVEE